LRVRKQTASGDYSFGNSQLDFYKDVPAGPGQVASTVFQLFLGEWFLDLTTGTPFFQSIFGFHSKQLADRTIQDRILSAQGVTGIVDYTSTIDPDTRQISVTTTIDTLYGQTTIQLQNQVNT